MYYIINEEQETIIRAALASNGNIRSFNDLEHTEFYKPLIASHEPYIPKSLVNREIAYFKCEAENDEQYSEFRKSHEFSAFVSWGAGEIEFASQGLYLDMMSFKDPEMKSLFLFILHLARIAREKVQRSETNSGVPGSDEEFQAAVQLGRWSLGVKP